MNDLAHDPAPIPGTPETWTGQQRGRALHMVYVLANTDPSEWRSKKELAEALKEFRAPASDARSQHR